MSTPATPSGPRRSTRSSITPRRGRDSATLGPSWNTPPPSTRTIEHVARLLPEGHSLRHASPERTLERLFDELQNFNSRHYARYAEYITGGGSDLANLLTRCVRKEVWDIAGSNSDNERLSVKALQSIGGDTSFYGRAIYLHIVHHPDNTSRLYVGQAFNLAARIRNQHSDYRYRRDHPSLHNFAMDRSIADEYVVLATVREAVDRSDLVLNLLEMWMALWLETLPEEVLNAWLGERDPTASSAGDDERVWGLNVAEPLDQGDGDAWKSAFGMLRDSEDEMAREYFWDVRKRPRPVPVKTANKKMLEIGQTWTTYVPIGVGILAIGFMVGRWTSKFAWRK